MKRIFHLLLIIIALVAAVPAMAQPTPTATPLAPITATLEVKGLIEAFTSNSVTLGGQTYAFTNDALDDDVRLMAGVPIEIKLVQRGDDWVVTQVDDEETPIDESTDGELKGTLESVDGLTIVVSGITLDISDAVIDDALVVGNPVEVYVTQGANGVWLATRIEDNFGDDLNDEDDDRDNDDRDDSDDDRDESDDDRSGSNSGSSDDDDNDNSNSGSGNSGDDDNDDDSNDDNDDSNSGSDGGDDSGDDDSGDDDGGDDNED